eukprot:m.28026 g.28026  ORF g.28026 m.28026 type:complete len:125 (+) comp30530_c0_seq1:38-412(+)
MDDKPLCACLALHISTSLGKSWKDIFRLLGFREGVLEAIEAKHPGDIREQCMKAIHSWLESHGDNSASKLICALEAAEKRHLAEIVKDWQCECSGRKFNYCSIVSERSQPGRTFVNCVCVCNIL